MMLVNKYLIKASNDNFLTISNSGKILCNKSNEKEGEIFSLIYSGRYVSFKTKDGKYLSVSQSNYILADKDKIDDSERFEIEWLNEYWFILKCYNGLFVSTDKEGKLEANRKNTIVERFQLQLEESQTLQNFLGY